MPIDAMMENRDAVLDKALDPKRRVLSVDELDYVSVLAQKGIQIQGLRVQQQ